MGRVSVYLNFFENCMYVEMVSLCGFNASITLFVHFNLILSSLDWTVRSFLKWNYLKIFQESGKVQSHL
jgi:hypothetical protein